MKAGRRKRARRRPQAIDCEDPRAVRSQQALTDAFLKLLEARPLNLDILQLYIVLMAFFPPVLWLMLRKPDLVLAGSAGLYVAARAFDWNLRSLPDGNWYFNPYCWQLLFVLGAWFAFGGFEKCRALLKSSMLFYLAIAYLVFALVMTMAGRLPELGDMLPANLFFAFNPNDRVNLALIAFCTCSPPFSS